MLDAIFVAKKVSAERSSESTVVKVQLTYETECVMVEM